MMKQWHEAFQRDPKQAVTDLFSGRAGLGSSLRLDIPELLYQEFPNIPEFVSARQALDNALLAWLSAMRRDYAKQVKRLGYGVYSKRLCDALITVQLLDLPLTTYQLRETANSWLNWLTPLRLAPERDPALEYWHVLTRRQREDASPATWLQLANDPRHEYLNVALIGLQRLPTAQNAQRNQQTQLLAVLQHAVLLADSGAAYQFFNRHYATLRAIYPASPKHWDTLLAAVLTNFRAKSNVAKQLLEKLRQPTTPARPSKQITHSVTVQPVASAERDSLLNDINKSKQSAESLAQRFFKILDQNYAYAQATGDSHFFITTLSNLGTRLLKRHKLTTPALNRLQQMIERGLSLEPMYPFTWMLWANCLAHLNQPEAQQWVLREAARLFPNNEPSRVELARLLMRQGDDKEAEKWLRDVVALSPNNEPSRVELARLLMRQGDDQQAEKWLREVVALSPNHEPSRVELARLLMRQGDDKQAEKWLREVVALSPNNEPSRVELARLLMRQGNDKEAEKWLREVVALSPNNGHSRVMLAQLLVRQGRTSEAEKLLTEFLARNPRDTKAQEVLQRIQRGRIDFTELDFEIEDDADEYAIARPIRLVKTTDSFKHHEISSLPDATQISPSHVMPQHLDLPEPQKISTDSVPIQAVTASPVHKIEAAVISDAEAEMNEEKLSPLAQLLRELEHRADLQIEFNQAEKFDKIQQYAAEGDALACLYQQWLQPDTLANSPPYAWAAQACRLYQTHASVEQWTQLNQTFPEKRLLNRFVSVQQTDNQHEFNALLNKLAHDKESHTPLQDFMYQVLQPGHAYDKDKAIFSVLASAAVDAPQFMT